ncbi:MULTISPECIES: hypothetical protein [Streptomyces]|uniref:Uncharacterized protein n=2 Tax=Streptomyces TaxID=1883 RepID=A0A3Q9G0U7_STRLT|nr:hypothetical protein [Streptomyces luteoverticillatus]AZQ72932.1 hypothetical protein EKH77_18485 [Streptomyces luteoverticillatus]
MSSRIAFRALAALAATAALSLPVAQGASAATPPARPTANTVVDENPFRWMDLDGLRAEYRFMCPAGHCVGYWSLVLTDEVARRPYRGGEFFVYAPATGEFGFFLDTDIATRTVRHPRQVRLVDSDFTRSHPRFEVRYGDPAQPKKARVVATATIWM